jgi:hypothetical protein
MLESHLAKPAALLLQDYHPKTQILFTHSHAAANRWPITTSQHVYEVRPRKDHRGVDLISDALPFGRLWYGEADAISNAIGYAKFYSRSHDALIHVYDAGVPNPNQHVQCRMACAWPFFTSSSS